MPIALVLALGVFAMAAAACGGSSKSTRSSFDEPVEYEPTTTHTDDSLSDQECAKLLDHVLAVSIEEVRKDSPDSVPDQDKQGEIRAALHQDIPKCQREVGRLSFQCAMKATSTVDIEECAR